MLAIGPYWALHGVAGFIWMLGCHLGCNQPQKIFNAVADALSDASGTKECYL